MNCFEHLRLQYHPNSNCSIQSGYSGNMPDNDRTQNSCFPIKIFQKTLSTVQGSVQKSKTTIDRYFLLLTTVDNLTGRKCWHHNPQNRNLVKRSKRMGQDRCLSGHFTYHNSLKNGWNAQTHFTIKTDTLDVTIKYRCLLVCLNSLVFSTNYI